MSHKQILAGAVLTLFALGSAANAATPTLEMSLMATGTGATSNANSGLKVDSTHLGVLFYNTALGDFVVNLNTGFGIGSLNPTVGQGIQLTNTSITGGANAGPSSTLKIVLVEDMLTGANNNLQAIAESLSTTALLTPGSSITMDTYINVGGNDASFLSATGAFTASGTHLSTLSLTSGGASGQNLSPTFNTGNTVFAEALVLTIKTTAGTNLNASGALKPQPVAAPEPLSIASFGLGLAALGFIRRRKAAAA